MEARYTRNVNTISRDLAPFSTPNKPQEKGDIKFYGSEVNIVSLAKKFGLNYSNIVKYVSPERTNKMIERYEYELNLPHSYLNTPVYNQTILHLEEEPNIQGGEVFDGKSIILNESIISVNQQKNIISNSVPGYRGTIKELTSVSDYSFTINGMIVSRSDYKLDYNILNTFKNILNYSDTIYISNEFISNIFGINRMVITNWEMAQSENSVNTVFFRMNALSDDFYKISY